ncbi:MAG: hypothetical protein GC161_04390 [Planctomycetaceae bacterium]|nr:hypothetical protein [Planctomycetaceae bacterium]
MDSPRSGERPPAKRLRTALVLALLVVPMAAGLGLWTSYAARPGPGPDASLDWPAGSSVERALDRPTLLVFAHPRCPCTRASLENLDRLLTNLQRSLRTEVLLWTPAGLDLAETEAFADSSVLHRARAMPGISVRLDPGGDLATHFGARTSGTALLFGPDGRLRYAGGLTFARGHEGEGVATAKLLAAIAQAPAEVVQTAVFGCSLLEPAELASVPKERRP